jgi:hypothetical protein
MLNIPSFTKRLEAPAPPPHMDPNGGALSGYTGHCPRQASPPANYRRTIRAQPPLAAKVGSTPQQHWLPRSRSAITPPPSWRDTVKGAGGAAGKLDEFLAKSISMKGIVTNDWRAHQPEEPPSLPQSSRSYRRAVGGIMVGWSGSVPHSAAHFGSNPVGAWVRESIPHPPAPSLLLSSGGTWARQQVASSSDAMMIMRPLAPPLMPSSATQGICRPLCTPLASQHGRHRPSKWRMTLWPTRREQ